jgi:hypothetical protein
MFSKVWEVVSLVKTQIFGLLTGSVYGTNMTDKTVARQYKVNENNKVN